jgi:hypothetical protein
MLLSRVLFFSMFLSAVNGFAQFQKALDGHAILCNNSIPENIEQVKYDKALRIQVLEQTTLEDVAEATIQIKLVEEACSGDALDPAPRTFDGVFVESYVLTVSTSEGQLLFKETLNDLLNNSIETLTFGVPSRFAKQGSPLEIGIQVMGRVSQNREMFDPYQGRFGVFIFKFSQKN